MNKDGITITIAAKVLSFWNLVAGKNIKNRAISLNKFFAALKLPEIKYWSQVTVNSVKICWTLPNDNNDIDDDSYDFFRVGVERLRNPDSLVKFEKEEFVKDMTKGALLRNQFIL